MARTTIEWTNYTWNPWVGCKKVSAGCKNCYMYREQEQRGNDPALIRRTKTLNDPLKWNKETGNKKSMVFTCSYSDFFIEEADNWRNEAWDIIRRTPNLIYQILTKRPERILGHLPIDYELINNVWLGVTAENQKEADKRIPLLLKIKAPIRFVSVEPMLERINLNSENLYPKGSWLKFGEFTPYGKRPIHWIICGCESGKNARPMELDWVRDLRNQCELANVPFFLKQMMIDGKLVKMPELDGKVWAQYPMVRNE